MAIQPVQNSSNNFLYTSCEALYSLVGKVCGAVVGFFIELINNCLSSPQGMAGRNMNIADHKCTPQNPVAQFVSGGGGNRPLNATTDKTTTAAGRSRVNRSMERFPVDGPLMGEGLPNPRVNCYLNSALQSLFACDAFIEAIRNRPLQAGSALQRLRDDIVWLKGDGRNANAYHKWQCLQSIAGNPLIHVNIDQMGDASLVVEKILEAFNLKLSVREAARLNLSVEEAARLNLSVEEAAELRKIVSREVAPISFLELSCNGNNDIQNKLVQAYGIGRNQQGGIQFSATTREVDREVCDKNNKIKSQKFNQYFQRYIIDQDMPACLTVKFQRNGTKVTAPSDNLQLPLYDRQGQLTRVAHLELVSFICHPPRLHFYAVCKNADGRWITKDDADCRPFDPTVRDSVEHAVYRIAGYEVFQQRQ